VVQKSPCDGEFYTIGIHPGATKKLSHIKSFVKSQDYGEKLLGQAVPQRQPGARLLGNKPDVNRMRFVKDQID